MARYLDYLERELDILSEILNTKRGVVQMHFGGGTPTYYNAKSLEEKGLIYMLEETTLKDNLEKALEDILKKYDEIMMNLDKYTLNNVSDSFLEKIKLYIEGD